LKDMEERTGASTDRIQVLQQVLAQSGVSAEMTNAAIERFTKNIGEARAGSGELVSSLKGSNRAFLDLLRTAPSMDAALQIAFDRLAAIPDTAERAALATDLFGKQGVKLAAIVKGGAVNFDALTEALRRNGSVLDKETIDKADEAGDRLMALGKTLDTVKNNFILSFTPELLSLARGWQALIDLKNGTLFPQVSEFDKVSAKLFEVNKALAELQARKEANAAQGKSIFGNLFDRLDTSTLEKRKAALEAQRDALLESFKAGERLTSQKQAAAATVEELSVKYGLLADMVEQSTEANEANEKSEKELAETRARAAEIVKSNRTELEVMVDDIDELNDLYSRGALTLEQYNTALDRMAVGLRTVEDSARKGEDIARQWGNVWTSALEDVVVEMIMAGDQAIDFQRILRALLADLVRIAARKAITDAIANFGATDGAAVIGGGGPGSGSIGQVGAFAAGGFVPPHSLALVGEKGPELVAVGGMGATVVPNHALGGDTYNVSFSGVRAADIPQLNAWLQTQAPSIAAMARVQMVEGKRRGGRG
jgi:hypothetical protein